jgi:hypothetical protein
VGLDDARTRTILNFFLREGRRVKKEGLRVASGGDERQSLSWAVSSNLTIWAETQDWHWGGLSRGGGDGATVGRVREDGRRAEWSILPWPFFSLFFAAKAKWTTFFR